MNVRDDAPPAPKGAATTAAGAANSGAGEKPASNNNNDRWDADEQPWRHPPVTPNDESPAKSLGRSVSDAIVSTADDALDDKAEAKPKP
jgi:hypothetical protein